MLLEWTGLVEKTEKLVRIIEHNGIDEEFQPRAELSMQRLVTRKRLDYPDAKLTKRIFMQSVQGHAQAGHSGFFSKLPDEDVPINEHHVYPDATMWDVVEALGDTAETLAFTDDVISGWQDYFLELVDVLHAHRDILRDHRRNGRLIAPAHPLQAKYFGAKPGDMVLTAAQVQEYLGGVYLGSVMDSHEWRQRAEERYDSLERMHKGATLAIDTKKLQAKGITIQDLSRGAYRKPLGLAEDASAEQILSRLFRLGIAKKGDRHKTTSTVQNLYVELSRGCGTSDDTSIITSGLMLTMPASLGVEASDQIDTLDKFSLYIVNGGTDEDIGSQVRHFYEYRMQQPFPLEDEAALALIRIAAKESDYAFKVSSSQRYLHAIDGDGKSALSRHLSFVRTLRECKPHDLGGRIGFFRVDGEDFYDDVRHSLEVALQERVLQDPNGILNGKRQPVGQYEPALRLVS